MSKDDLELDKVRAANGGRAYGDHRGTKRRRRRGLNLVRQSAKRPENFRVTTGHVRKAAGANRIRGRKNSSTRSSRRSG